jgi:uncharacterized membrane protein
MTDFFQKRAREKLYKQWVEKEGLSPEDLPADLKKDERNIKEAGGKAENEAWSQGKSGQNTGQQLDRMFTSTSLRFIFVLAIIIAILLVALSVLSTILIMRGC